MDWGLIRRLIRRIDWGLVLAVVLLMGFGVLFIYSASYRGDGLPVSPFYRKQLVWFVLGLVSFLAMVAIDYHRLGEAAWWLYLVGVALLVLVLFFGTEVHGSHRWLRLFGIQVQPSEFAKLATLLLLARYLSRPGRDVGSPRAVITVCALTLIPAALIIQEPDLGTAAVLGPMAFVMLYAAGVPLRKLGILLAIGLLFLPFAWFGLDDYQRNRLLVFFDPGRDPLGSGWNKMQSEIAVGSGGLTGKGYLQGTQNVLGFLPRTVAPTDFIYSVIAEEMGFVGSALVMLLYAAVLIATIRAALLARDKLGRLLAVGMAAVIYCHVFVNIAMTIGLMPITGLPLPLISYGGSFTVSTMIGLGMIQSVFVRRYRR